MGSSQGCLRQDELVLGPLKLGQASGWTLNQRTKTVHVGHKGLKQGLRMRVVAAGKILKEERQVDA